MVGRGLKQLVLNRDPDIFFIALLVIALTIIVDGFVRYLPHYFGHTLDIPGIVVWWISFVAAIFFMLFIPFCLARFSHAELGSVLPFWILISVPGTVVAAVGAGMTGFVSLDYASSLRHIMYGTWIVLGLAGCQTAIVLVLVTQRLLLVGLPPHFLITSLFFPVAPLSLIGDAFLELSVGMPRLYPNAATDGHAVNFGSEGASVILVLAAIATFGFTIFWILMALAAIASALIEHRHIPYSPAWWGMAFPMGLSAILTIRLGDVLNVDAFKIVGTASALVCCIGWAVTFAATLYHGYTGRLFVKPGTKTH